MAYRFATENQNYSDLASGRVLYNQPGAPAFPVRLASEIFQRAVHHLNPGRRITIYDPTCGGAYHLAALGFLHGKEIASILASDIDPNILETARRNLGLLSTDGLAQREGEIRRMLAAFDKESHAEALASLTRLRQRLQDLRHLTCRIFTADALDASSMENGLAEQAVDLIFSDVPYGRLTGWKAASETPPDAPPSLWRMLEALHGLMKPGCLVAIAADKSQKFSHEGYQRVERFPLGKRQVTFLRLY